MTRSQQTGKSPGTPVRPPWFHDAEKVLMRFGAEPGSAARTASAAERFFSKLARRFHPLVGREGYRALVEQTRMRVAEAHPILEKHPVPPGNRPVLRGLGESLAGEDAGEVWNAVRALAATFLELTSSIERRGRGNPGSSARSASIGGGATGPKKRPYPRVPRSPESWRVLVWDRDRATSEAIGHTLSVARDFHVVGFARTGEDARERIKADGVDFVIACAHLPHEDVFEMCRWLRREYREDPPFVVVTGVSPDPSVLLRFVEAGAASFTLEEFSIEGLRVTVRLLARGEAVFPLRFQHLMAMRLAELSDLVRSRGLEPDALWTLTGREGEVLLFLEKGYTNRKIGRQLFISEGTVKSHVHQILRKLKVRDRNEAVRLLQLQRASPGQLVLEDSGFRLKS